MSSHATVHAAVHATTPHAYPQGSWSIPPNGFASSGSMSSQSSSSSSNLGITSPTGIGIGGGFLAPPGGRRYTSRTGNPYQSAVAKRRTNAIASGAREPRAPATQPDNGEEAERTPRRRVIVACTRCRRRKIRCSGDDGTGSPCTNCKNANEPQCQFLRVNAATMRVRPREGEGWGGVDFNYDLDACRQYQSRGTGTVMATMAMPGQTAASTYAATSGGIAIAPVGMYQQSGFMYGWSGQGSPAGSTKGYGSYQSSYSGMPSPEPSFMSEHDLIERPSTASTMADAGAFALHSMAHGLPLSRSNSSNASPYCGGSASASGGGGCLGSPALLTTPRCLPGPPSVLGSSRLPSSSSSSLFSRPSTYPSPVTTPVIHGAGPAWSSGYEPSPYTTVATPVPSSMAAQSLERLPDLYSATPPPPPQKQEPQTEPLAVSATENASGMYHQAGCMVGGSSSQPQHQQQYGYAYGEEAAAATGITNSDLKREPGHDEAGGADGTDNTMSGRY